MDKKAADVTHPAFSIEGPALVSFSGGRSSAFMLHEIMRAHGGKMPENLHVCFANTGKELEETLRFVHECGSRWGIPIAWLEWRDTKPCHERVGFNSASRAGEPFDALITKKRRLPNWQERWCTSFLKIKPMHDYMREMTGLEPGQYVEAVGLRDDEPERIGDMVEGDARSGRHRTAPLARAKIAKPAVLEFWAAQPFDLGLEGWDGNCDVCFATGRGVRVQRLRRRPQCGKWWLDQETKIGGTFDRRDSVADLMKEAAATPDLFEAPLAEYDAECGLYCGAETV
jgi:3'-phosphoadenosine 5'-phosphosulfate sulfotransferase (PAPS reductase)/FAD synthetase